MKFWLLDSWIFRRSVTNRSRRLSAQSEYFHTANCTETIENFTNRQFLEWMYLMDLSSCTSWPLIEIVHWNLCSIAAARNQFKSIIFGMCFTHVDVHSTRCPAVSNIFAGISMHSPKVDCIFEFFMKNGFKRCIEYICWNLAPINYIRQNFFSLDIPLNFATKLSEFNWSGILCKSCVEKNASPSRFSNLFWVCVCLFVAFNFEIIFFFWNQNDRDFLQQPNDTHL